MHGISHCISCSLWRRQSDLIGVCMNIPVDKSDNPSAPCVVIMTLRGATVPSADVITRSSFGCLDHQPNGRAELAVMV